MNTQQQVDFELTDQETVDLIRRLERIDQKSSAIASIAEATGRSEEEVRHELELMRQEQTVVQQPVERIQPVVSMQNRRFAIAGALFFFAIFFILMLSLTRRPPEMATPMVLPSPVEARAPDPMPARSADMPPPVATESAVRDARPVGK